MELLVDRFVYIEIDAKGFDFRHKDELIAQATKFAEHIGLSSAIVDCLEKNHVTIYYDGFYIPDFDEWLKKVTEQWNKLIFEVTGNSRFAQINWSPREGHYSLGEYLFMSPVHEHSMNVTLNLEYEVSIEEDYFESSIEISKDEIGKFLSHDIQKLKQNVLNLIQKTWPDLPFKKFEYKGTNFPYCAGIKTAPFTFNRITPEVKSSSLFEKLRSIFK